MPRNNGEELERIHILLNKADADQLRELFAESIGVTRAIRQIIRQYLKRLNERLEEETKDGKPADRSQTDLPGRTVQQGPAGLSG